MLVAPYPKWEAYPNPEVSDTSHRTSILAYFFNYPIIASKSTAKFARQYFCDCPIINTAGIISILRHLILKLLTSRAIRYIK